MRLVERTRDQKHPVALEQRLAGRDVDSPAESCSGVGAYRERVEPRVVDEPSARRSRAVLGLTCERCGPRIARSSVKIVSYTTGCLSPIGNRRPQSIKTSHRNE